MRQRRRTAEEAIKEALADLKKPLLTPMSSVLPEEVSFLWEPYLPRGKVCMLEGDPGVGKTTLATHVAALVSSGTPFPGNGADSGPRKPERVLYLSAEDGLADTLRPRLEVSGAHLDNVIALEGASMPTILGTFEPRRDSSLVDLVLLGKAVEEVRPALVIIDPIQAFLVGVDMHRANEVRPVLSALADLGAKYGAVILLIRHLSKSPAAKALYRGLGSVDFTAAARSVLLAGQDPADPDRRAVIHVKSSLSKPGPGVGYAIRDGRFHFIGPTDLTADQILSGFPPEESQLARVEAEKFLEGLLNGGPVPVREVEEAAKAAGVRLRTLDRARKALGCVATPEGSNGRRGAARWLLSLPVGRTGAAASECRALALKGCEKDA